MSKIPAFGLLLFACAAWFNVGYHHPDEHFQILEFANFKLGKAPLADLPWEFHERIRPGLQPWLTFIFLKFSNFVGLTDPFVQAFLLRLASGVAVFGLFFLFSKRLSADFERAETGRWLLAAACFLWFMPYLSVRFSSENWGALAFFSGLLLLPQQPEQPRKNSDFLRLLAAGFVLGLSFWFRFQMGFALLGVAAWLFFFKKMPPAGWLWLALGGAWAMAVGLETDWWLYGERVFTPYYYYTANITQDRAVEWGESPWWFYLTDFVVSAAPPLSLALLALAARGFWVMRRHVLAWVFVPFLLGHLLVGHKELRFLFPMLLPFLAFAARGAEIFFKKYSKKWFRPALGLCLVVNGLLLVFRSLAPAQEAIPFFKFLHRFASQQTEPILLFSEINHPFRRAGLRMNFYKPENIDPQVLTNLRFIQYKVVERRPQRFLVFHKKLRLDFDLPGYRKTRVYSLYPEWIERLNFNDWQSRSRVWSVWLFEAG